MRWAEGAVTVDTDGGEVEADAAVIAIPTRPLADVEFDPPLQGATAAALRAVTYGQNSKLFLPLRSPAPPSAVMSVAGHFWTYTQNGPGGEPAPFVVGYTGTMAAIEALGGSAEPERWVAALAALRPDLDLDADPAAALLSSWDEDPWVRGSYSARSLSSPIRDADLAAADRPAPLRRRAHRRRVARPDGGRPAQRPPRRRPGPHRRRDEKGAIAWTNRPVDRPVDGTSAARGS